MRLAAIFLALAGLLAACAEEHPPSPTFHADENPSRLSEWGMLANQKGALLLGETVQPYDLASPLFSDYASKLRTIWLPQGATLSPQEDGKLDFPVGAVLTKTFYYRRSGERVLRDSSANSN